MTIYIVIIPHDYQSAEAIPFDTEQEARLYVKHQVDKQYQVYATVRKCEV